MTEDLLREAISLHRQDNLNAAEPLYQQILAAEPRQPDALHFLGVLRHQQGRSEEAIDLLREALDVAPGYVDAWNNLGNIQKENGRIEAAEAAYRKALACNPQHPGAWNNLGVVLRARGACREAIAALNRVLELAPEVADTYVNLANALHECGDVEEAITAYRRALSLNPTHRNAIIQFGYVLAMTGRQSDAQELFRDWLAADPSNSTAAHMLAACGGSAVPDRASDDYVRGTFDRFASSFDEQLLQRLSYRAPELLAAALNEVLGDATASLEVLDAGCGTGLCGPLLRPYAGRLEGVDLSPGMLAKARERGFYDELHEAELTGFLATHPGAFDVVASADTLVYFGALQDVAAAAHGALRPGGWLGFTVERIDDIADFRINPHGRYSHSESYLRRVLADAGFAAVTVSPAVLRTEFQQPVNGWVVRAQVP